MKRTTLYISAALALALALAACTKEDTALLPEASEGTPMTFTATGLNPAIETTGATAASRAPVDGNWQDVTSVAVRIGEDVKVYNVTPDAADNTRATLASTDPHYWTGHDTITVSAWWPCTDDDGNLLTTMPDVKVAENQSKLADFQNSDLIVAEEQTVSYGNPTLRFTHRTALVHIVLTTYTDGMASVQLTGLSTVDGNPAAITPHDKGGYTYAALVAPQTVTAGTAFITCTFTNGKSYVYRMKTDAQWKAGEEYTYTVSLAAADPVGYTYDKATNTYTVHNANGLLAWAEAAWTTPTLNCTLADDIDLTDKEWVPMGETGPYTGTFDGGGHRITGLTVTWYKYAGFIGFIGPGGTVQNVTLEDVKIRSSKSGWCVGGVAAKSSGKIENCSVSGSVSSNYTSIVGGVVGDQVGGSITGCSSSATVYSKGITVGGVVGNNSSGTLIACYAWGKVTGSGSGTIYVGGVTGTNKSGTLTACYWNNSLATGIGSGSGEATKVDGSTTWQTAQSGMNEAINAWNGSNPNKQCNWHYVGATETTPPTLAENNTTNP